MSRQDLNQTKPFCSPQDQIQWGILTLGQHLRKLSAYERRQCLQEVWEWARQRADLPCLQMIRDYRGVLQRERATYRRHQDWFLSELEQSRILGGVGKAIPEIQDREERG